MNTTLIKEARRFVREEVMPVVEQEPRFQVSPDEYSFKVGFPGRRRCHQPEIIEAMKRQLANEENVSLYAHMPVCLSRCGYCHYPVIVSRDPVQVSRYVKAIIRESDLLLDILPDLRHKQVTSLYFGGGTPTLIQDEEIEHLLIYFREQYQLAEDIEISFEGTPETFTDADAKVRCLLEQGVNRVSLGIQILDDTYLVWLNRLHTSQVALNALERLVKAGFRVNVDLIYGFPNQPLEKLAKDIERIMEFNPTNITLYRLRLGRDDFKSRLANYYRRHPAEFPSLEEVYTMQILGRRLLVEDYGLVEGPAGWYCQPNFYPIVYWDRWIRQIPLIALGWCAYSYGKRYEYHNAKAQEVYFKRLARGQLPIEQGWLYSLCERQRRFVAFRLKALYAVGRLDFKQEFGEDFLTSSVWPSYQRLLELGLLEVKSEIVQLTEVGKVLIEEV